MGSLKEHLLFLRVSRRHPLQVGSAAPSSRRLVAAMLQGISWAGVQTVVELGAGTGAITKAVLAAKPQSAQLLVFEREPAFQAVLRERYPELNLFADARDLRAVLAGRGLAAADVILSGIPFALLPAEQQDDLLDEIASCLAPGGMFVAFQYSLLLYRRLQRRFRRVSLGFAAVNLPPAFVYRCYKG